MDLVQLKEEKVKVETSGEVSQWRFYKKIQELIAFQPSDESPTLSESLNCKIVEYGNDSFVQRCWETEVHDSSNNEVSNTSDHESDEDGSIQICLNPASPAVTEASTSSAADRLDLPPQHGDGSRDESSQLTRSSTIATSKLKRSRTSDPEPSIANGDSNIKMKANVERSECEVFAELVLKKLRRYNPITRHIVEHHINTILFQADMGQYSDPTPYMNWSFNTSNSH
ncbi:uncharacterized protein LOC129220957 [Uloborus diversus]|uniref:uncharacterized protein LOC129220957 n=1 Tax=Uloborus diversus TaxID=327109 RepID=UPI00240A7E46|nr:uncharacterized protein LOC129220957 [Uloborus diversus]